MKTVRRMQKLARTRTQREGTRPLSSEESIEILTGMAAGKKNGDGKFEPGTVLALIDERLSAMARTLKEFE